MREQLLPIGVVRGLSGKELWESMGAAHSDVQAIFISGYTEDSAVRQAVRDGEICFLPKPFRPAELLAKVAQALSARPPGPVDSGPPTASS